jgi:hypothetical protein
MMTHDGVGGGSGHPPPLVGGSGAHGGGDGSEVGRKRKRDRYRDDHSDDEREDLDEHDARTRTGQ